MVITSGLPQYLCHNTYAIFRWYSHKAKTYEERDRALAFFAPTVLLLLPVVFITLLTIAYTPIYWVLGVGTLYDAFLLSGSSLLTLGYAGVADYGIPVMILSFTDAALGMIMVALLIAYLPTIYGAFSEREKQVAMLEIRAGTPPSGVILLTRVFRNQGNLSYLDSVWTRWEEWFAHVEESHTSLIVLVFFRSPQMDRSWITAAGAVLDAAALLDAVVDQPRSIESVMMIRGGYIALRKVADFFDIAYNPNPTPDDILSISRDEFDEAYDFIAESGIAVIADRDQAWRDFAGWRVNYDRVLISIARLIAAPYAPWSSDRSLPDMENLNVRD